MRKLVCLILALALALSTASMALAEERAYTTYTRVQTTAGTLQGYTFDGVNTFLGVQYATAERFMPPQKVQPWDGVKLAMYVGEVCPAGKSTTSAAEFITPSGIDNVENEATCLNLNVWTPTLASDAKLPVIFWVHGGGYSSGSSIELVYYEGHNMAKTGEAVFVSINHRLNVLGFLDLSAYGEEYKYSGNAGMADIVCALEWVRDNITAFGGDPDNVTIVGQSGGAGKVLNLMGVPSAQGLFDKVVAQSGGPGGTPQETARAKTATMLENLGLTADAQGVEALKAMPYDELLAAANKAGAGSGPVIDNDFFLGAVADGQFNALAKDIPLMIGTAMTEIMGNNVKYIARGGRFPADGDLSPYCLDDMSEEKFQELVTAKYGEKADAAVAAFQKAYPELDKRHLLFFNAQNYSTANMKATQGGANVYSYVFDYEFPIFGGCVAWHTGGDIPFFFRNVDDVEYMIAGDEEGAYKLMDVASRAMLNFARTGDPSQDGLTWEPHTAENGAVMVFNANSELRYHHDDDLWAVINAK